MASERGFTLIECMVALLIIGMALPALLMNVGTMSNSASNARETMVAYWIAENKLQEIYLTQKLQNKIPRGVQADDVKMAGKTWDLQTEAVDMPPLFPGMELVRLYVRVRHQGEDLNLVEISGYLRAR